MKITSGKIVAGQIVVEDMPFDEGATVTVFSREDSDSFELSVEQEAELLASAAEADHGETIPASELLKSLRPQT
ncbi:hypothetical protein GJ699_05535 [Duganella sp. FT80W]|uniref:Uncharacterized protein n=1 Tax=Duganella guangzhouensis TaxID=2666084 RepID=A0A6I2KZJ2_9BURK|nr:hypothetical protein [Duganella guangzhouensis]MRW89439.1 hypothetical protein [Duganella guangzhouensis]